ncbi:GPI-anchor transamidase subunit gab1 [Mactra antiquata]
MKPAQSLPGTYLLNYYRDENCKNCRGCIDLEQCAEIIESLDSDQFEHLLAIKTTHRGKDRTYFLATQTEEQMTTWVRNLCSVCGMKPDESGEPDSPQPPERENLPMRTAISDQPVASLPQSAVGIMTKPPQVSSPSSSAAKHSPATQPRRKPANSTVSKPKPPAVTDRDLEYIPLDTCTSGSQRGANRQISIDSVPDEPAPPPPIKGASDNIDNDVFQGVYDIPPSSTTAQDLYDRPPPSLEEDDIYKVPPPRPTSLDNQVDMYDIPPPTRSSPGTTRSSSSDSQKADSAYSSQGLPYDFPPHRDPVADDIYDIPPSHPSSVDEVPPTRPPKPGHLQPPSSAQEPYMNLPPNSKAFSEQSKHLDINDVVMPQNMMTKVDLELYDFPKSSAHESQDNYKNLDPSEKLLMATPPPPPSKCGMVDHRYINAAQGTVQTEDEYLPMDPVLGISDSHKPRESSSTDNECEYTDMTGHSSFEESTESKQSLYDIPPTRTPMAPPRPINRPTAEIKGTIVKNARTKSFKRKEGSPLVQRKSPTFAAANSNLTSSSVLLPKRVDNGKHPDFSTSDEDDDDMGSTEVWETTPPAPGNKDTELKYVDLDHDDASDKEPMRSPHGAPGGVTPTEYHEIDFVKTDALRNVKESVERSKEKNHT